MFNDKGLSSDLTIPYDFVEDPECWPSPLLHLVHPFALKNFLQSLGHVRRFNGFLRSLSARNQNSLYAQETLVDLVDTSGINLDVLEGSLRECVEVVENLPGKFKHIYRSTSSSYSISINPPT